jgi:protein phosphatase 1 regulatory subunit 7
MSESLEPSETTGSSSKPSHDDPATNQQPFLDGIPPTAEPVQDPPPRPLDAKGWDGKLRIDPKTLRGEEPDSDGREEDGDEDDDSDTDADNGPKQEKSKEVKGADGTGQVQLVDGEEIAADEDLLEDYDENETEVQLIHCRISSIESLRLERFKQLKQLCLRQNSISEISLPEELAANLEELDFYDNLISHIRGLDAFTELRTLDLSFNKLKHIKRLSHLTNLENLYFVQNRIATIENLDNLSRLTMLELGANRIREIQGLESLTALKELWLGKNKITELKGLDTLANLRILSIQSNRLKEIKGLDALVNLEQLHISHNMITTLGDSLSTLTNLTVIDISNNPIEHLEGLASQTKLEELWASYCKLSSFDEVKKELGNKESLETVYFEGNPLQTNNKVLYRNKVRLALPQVRQIDASKFCSAFTTSIPRRGLECFCSFWLIFSQLL